MADPLEQFVRHLEDSGILAGDTLRDFLPPRKHPKDALELLKDLLKQKKLTKYQAQQIRKGKGKQLVLGNYMLLEKIGHGGMGTVFKAEHRRMKRKVAVKMLPRDMLKDQRAGARFQREVEAAAKLRHPNIVAADDADEVNGVYFLVMEYIDGDNLLTTVKENGPLALDVAVDCILQGAKGLEFAHKKGVVHRDIKPSNFLRDPDGTVKILDMGLARINAFGDGISETDLTHTGAVLGTVDYMAPEQTLDAKEADHRADIYGLGCTLYYLLAGKKMYDGDTIMKRVMAHRFDPIPSLRAVRSDVPAELDAVYKKMVAKDKLDRYQTATEVLAAIAPFAAPFAASGLGPGMSSGISTGSASVQMAVPAPGPSQARPGQAGPDQFLDEPTTPTLALIAPPARPQSEPMVTSESAAIPEPSCATEAAFPSELAPPREPARGPEVVFASLDSLPPAPAPIVPELVGPATEFNTEFRSQLTDVPIPAVPVPAEPVSLPSSLSQSAATRTEFNTEFRSQSTDVPIPAAPVPAEPVSLPSSLSQSAVTRTEFNTDFRSQSTDAPIPAVPISAEPVSLPSSVSQSAATRTEFNTEFRSQSTNVPIPAAPVPAPEKTVERKFEPTSTDRSFEPNSTDRSSEPSSADRSSEPSVDRSSQRSTERSFDSASQRSTERSTGHSFQLGSERSVERSSERSTGSNTGSNTVSGVERTLSGTTRTRVREIDSQSSNQTWRANRPGKGSPARPGTAGWKASHKRRRMFGTTVVYFVLIVTLAALVYLLLS